MNDVITAPRIDPANADFLSQAKVIVEQVKESKNFDAGFGFINDLKKYGESFERAQGMMLEGMDSVWRPNEHDGETFYAASLRETGLSPATVERHIRMQRTRDSGKVPAKYLEIIDSKYGPKEFIKIANLVEGGWELDEEDWQKFSEVEGEKEVGRVVREITGRKPRSNWLSITIDSRGVLFEHTNEGVREIGRLNIHDDHPDVQKAIKRITGCAGIVPASEY